MNTKPLHRHTRSPYSQRGTATIELAILAVPLLMLAIGVAEYGRAIYQYNTLVKSVRNAARFLTAASPGHSHMEAKNLVVCGYKESCPDHSSLVPNLTVNMVKICDATNSSDCPGEPHSGVATGSPSSPIGTVNLVTVKITQPNNINLGYLYQPIFTSFMLGLAGGGQVSIGAPNIAFDPIKATMRQPL